MAGTREECPEKVLPFLLLFLAGMVLTWMSWGKWPDLMIDFGLQVYTPWQVAEGKVLYRDLVYFHGPATVYLHALLFQLFGPGILVLAIFNLLLAGGLTALIYLLFKRLGDAPSAQVLAFLFLTVFAFAQYKGGGNYNFISPYHYELTQGIFFVFLALYQLARYLETRKGIWLAGTGFLLGLVFLTKTEVFVAAGLALGLGIAIILAAEEISGFGRIRKFLLFLAPGLIPPFLFLVYFSFHMPWTEAARTVVSPYLHLADSSAVRMTPLYQWIMGIDRAGQNLADMILMGLVYVFGGVALLALNHIVHRYFKGSWLIGIACFGLVMVPLLLYFLQVPWLDLLRPMPLFMAAWAIYLFGLSRKKKVPEPGRRRILLGLTLTLFALALLFKIVLNVHVYHYGFALAMPAALVFLHFVLYQLPRLAERMSFASVYLKAASLSLVLCFLVAHVWLAWGMYQLKSYRVADGTDTIYDYDPGIFNRGAVVKTALKFIREDLEPGAGFAVFPTGSMLNYLARRPNPLPYMVYGPFEWLAFGEKPVLDDLKQDPPPYIVLVERQYPEFGARYFGKDYGQDIYAWIRNHYQMAVRIGNPPFTGQGYGIEILKRARPAAGYSS